MLTALSMLTAGNSQLSSKASMALLAAALPSASALATLGLNDTGITKEAGKVGVRIDTKLIANAAGLQTSHLHSLLTADLRLRFVLLLLHRRWPQLWPGAKRSLTSTSGATASSGMLAPSPSSRRSRATRGSRSSTSAPPASPQSQRRQCR